MAIASAACVGGSARSPSASASPTAPAAPTIISLSVLSVALSPSSFQLSATARFSDASSKDVTSVSKWESTNTGIAVVSSNGLVSAIANGAVEIHAIYQSTIGSTQVVVARPPGPSIFSLAGLVHEVAPHAQSLAGVRLAITAGPDFGTTVTADANGAFRFPPLSRGVIAVEASKDGYLIWKMSNWLLDQDRQIDIALFPIPPKNGDGVTATARCNDGSWSWEKSPMLVCADSGLAYVVCPGPLCQTP